MTRVLLGMGVVIATAAIGCTRTPAPGRVQRAAAGPAVEGLSSSISRVSSEEGALAPLADSPRIPIVPGLTIVTAYTLSGVCDCESVKQVTDATDDAVTLTYASDVPVSGVDNLFGADTSSGKVEQVRGRRTVRRQDLADAREYVQVFGKGVPELIAGTTALGVSSAVLRDLKARRQSALTMRTGALGTRLGGLIGAVAGPELAGVKEIRELDRVDKISGTIERVEAPPVPFRVLVNDRLVDLPVIHARGRLGDSEGDFYFLDDERNPLALEWELEDDRLHVIKIAFPDPEVTAAKESRIEIDLAEKGRAEIYGIYFDFGSDVLRSESALALDEIATTLRQHSDWSLRIGGHTDNVGTDAYNRDLSMRRAAAVKTALVGSYRIGADRLTTAGFGASRPKDTNETLQGRARNRRVELARQ